MDLINKLINEYKLYNNYFDVYQEYIKKDRCYTYLDYSNELDYGRKKEKIDYNIFMEKDTRTSNNYDSCSCYTDYFEKRRIDDPQNQFLFLEACKRTNIEKNQCIDLYSDDKIIKIRENIERSLTKKCNEKCKKYTEKREYIEHQMFIDEKNKQIKNLLRKTE